MIATVVALQRPQQSPADEKTRAFPHAFPLTSGKVQGTLPGGPESLGDPPEQLSSLREGPGATGRCFSNFRQSNGLGGNLLLISPRCLGLGSQHWLFNTVFVNLLGWRALGSFHLDDIALAQGSQMRMPTGAQVRQSEENPVEAVDGQDRGMQALPCQSM